MPLSRQQIYRRRRITVFGSLLVVLSAGFYAPMTLLAPLDTVSAQVLPYAAPATEQPELQFPGFGASAIGAVGFPGVLAQSGVPTPLPIASLTKVVTALVVLDKYPLTDGDDGATITFTSADVRIYHDYLAVNGKVLSVRAGMSLGQRDVLKLVLVGSANNYAQSLVNWAFGTEQEYAPAAAAWLGQRGLANTTIVDSTGMSPGNTSTAADLVELGKLALANPIVSEMIAMDTVSVPHLGVVENTNDLLGIAGVDGIKTGTLDEAGACLLFSADYQVGSETVAVVGVMLGGEDHDELNAHILALLATVTPGFQQVVLTSAGEPFASYTTPWGAAADAVAAQSASALVWSGTPVSAIVEAKTVGLAEQGSTVGSITFVAGDRRVKVPLHLDSRIEDPGIWWRLTHPADLF